MKDKAFQQGEPGSRHNANSRRRPRLLPQPAETASRGDLTLPLVLGALAVALGLGGWSAALFDGSFKSISEIIVRVIASFIPSANTVTAGNWASRLGAVFAALTTVTGAVMVALATLGEHLTRTAARRLWSRHIVLIGDTPLTGELARGFRAEGKRVLHIVPPEASKTSDAGRIRAGTDAPAILGAASIDRALCVVVDLDSDAATLSLGRSLLAASNIRLPRRSMFRRLHQQGRHRGSIALRVADSLLADQFSDLIDAERRTQSELATDAPMRPAIFDENRILARYTLARDPLFVLADAGGQAQVHAVVIGFGDLGEKLLDQVMLTSIAGSLGLPRVTVLDRHATQREREFRARRPAVLDNLNVTFLDLDIGLDPLEGAGVPPSFGRLVELEQSIGITAILLALPADAANLSAALLLRRHRERNGTMAAPIFYRSRLLPGESDVLGAGAGVPATGRFVPMRAPLDALLREVADPDGRDALAQALHQSYLQGPEQSEQAATAWQLLSEPLRRANIRAADHLPAKLWSLGLDIDGLLPGQIPAFDQAAKDWLFGGPGGTPAPQAAAAIAALARLEHDRWSIERKLDGWSYAPVRDDARRHHPLLVPWQELSPDQKAKDAEQVMALLRFVGARGKRPVISLRASPAD
jgi:hypothetical protein